MNNKKILLVVLLTVLIMPFSVKANPIYAEARNCKVINSNGQSIGSEVACGNEHFYVIDNSNNKLKMISKYNLYVGANYNKITLDITKTYMKEECNDSNCNYCYSDATKFYFDGEEVSSSNEWKHKIYEKYSLSGLTDFYSPLPESDGSMALYSIVEGEKYEENGKTYRIRTYKLYPYVTLNEFDTGFGLQNELARGVTGPKGKANYPIYATLAMFPSYNIAYSEFGSVEILDNYMDGYTNFDFKEDSYIKDYLNEYKNKLINMGYKVTDVDLITMKEINELVYKISGKNLPLTEWYDDSSILDREDIDGNNIYNLGDLKKYLSNDYNWLWNTTYWTKTFAGNDLNLNNNNDHFYVYFVSSNGDICYSYSECGGIPRAGLRPVVTIDKNIIKYLIRTKTDGNGTIEVIDSAFGNETIQFKVASKKGYKLKSVTIITDTGEKVEFKEGEITNNNGIYSIDKNKFTMPFENVTIEARWGIINPETGQGILVFLLIFTCLGVITYRYKKKNLKNRV